MAGEPKRRHSKQRKRVRRASIKLALSLTVCKNCHKPTLPHTVCKECGFYHGKDVASSAYGGKAVSKEKVKVTKA